MALPQLIAFHGFMGVGRDFEPFEKACGRTFWSPDLIGHGAFQCMDSSQYGLDAQLEYWSNRIPDGSVLIGYSMGGRLALQFACRYPNKLAGLVLIGATPGIQEEKARIQRQHWDRIQANRIVEMGVETFYNEWQKMPIIATQQNISPSIQAEMKSARLAQSIEGLSQSMLHFGTGTMQACWDALQDLQVPTLLMVGEHDLKYREIAFQMLGRIPKNKSSLAIISKTGHCAHLESLEECSRILVRWLSEIHDKI